MEIQLADGYTFMVGNIPLFLSFVGGMIYLCYMINSKQLDKVAHFCVCTVATVGLLAVLWFLKASWWIAPAMVALVGLIKEVVDYLTPSKQKFDLRDLVADVIGLGWVTVFYAFLFIVK